MAFRHQMYQECFDPGPPRLSDIYLPHEDEKDIIKFIFFAIKYLFSKRLEKVKIYFSKPEKNEEIILRDDIPF